MCRQQKKRFSSLHHHNFYPYCAVSWFNCCPFPSLRITRRFKCRTLSSDCLLSLQDVKMFAFLQSQPGWMTTALLCLWTLMQIHNDWRFQLYSLLLLHLIKATWIWQAAEVCVCVSASRHLTDLTFMASLQREVSLGKISFPWPDQREIFINHLHYKY